MKQLPIKDVAPGSKIHYKEGHKECDAWAIGHLYANSVDWLIGWKSGEDTGGLGWEIVSGDASYDLLKKFGCVKGWCVAGSKVVDLLNGSSTVSSNDPPLSCRVCHQFFPMAIPNRPDGIHLICWSCRQSWIPAGW